MSCATNTHFKHPETTTNTHFKHPEAVVFILLHKHTLQTPRDYKVAVVAVLCNKKNTSKHSEAAKVALIASKTGHPQSARLLSTATTIT